MTHTKNKCDKLSLFLDHKKLGGRFSVSHVINHKKYDITLSQRQLAVIREIRDFQLLVSRNKKSVPKPYLLLLQLITIQMY